MGLIQSAPKNRQYSSSQIKENISNMFKSGDHKLFSDATYSLGNMNVEDTPEPIPAANEVPKTNTNNNENAQRYMNYDIDGFIKNLKSGGVVEQPKLDDDSIKELDKIRDYLVEQQKTTMTGGGCGDSEISFKSILNNTMTPDTTTETQLPNFLKAIRGGAKVKDDSDSTDDLNDDFDDDNDDFDEKDSSSTKPTQNKQNFRTKKQKKTFSDTSYSVISSSELNIVPFYSSDASSDLKHPYIRNRFN